MTSAIQKKRRNGAVCGRPGRRVSLATWNLQSVGSSLVVRGALAGSRVLLRTCGKSVFLWISGVVRGFPCLEVVYRLLWTVASVCGGVWLTESN